MDTKIQPVIAPTKRGPYRQHSIEFKRAIVAKSLVEGTSVSRLAREFNINANQVFTWRKQFADVQGAVAKDGCQLLPVTLLESSDMAAEQSAPTSASASASGVILLTVGRAQLRLEGGVDPATLAQVLARLLP
ncbi:MAG: transposase [Pseudomonadota bacterium]